MLKTYLLISLVRSFSGNAVATLDLVWLSTVAQTDLFFTLIRFAKYLAFGEIVSSKCLD